MCPRISFPEEAQQAVDAIRYQPEGTRGAAMMVRAARFGNDFTNYYSQSKENLVVVIQIETKQVLDSLDMVAATDGVDVLFVGPLDLSIALGTFGQNDHPRFREAIEATSVTARKAGKAAGVLLQSPEEFGKYYDLGFRFIACGSDSAFVNTSARKTAEVLNSLRSSFDASTQRHKKGARLEN